MLQSLVPKVRRQDQMTRRLRTSLTSRLHCCGYLIRDTPDDRVVEVRLRPLMSLGKRGPSPQGLECTKAGDARALRIRNVDFVFIKTQLSRGSC